MTTAMSWNVLLVNAAPSFPCFSAKATSSSALDRKRREYGVVVLSSDREPCCESG